MMRISEEKIFQEIAENRITKEQALKLLKGISAGVSGESFPLSEGQKLLWVFSRLAPESYAYNVPQAFRVRNDIDTAALKEAVRLLIERHPSLRAVFRLEGDNPVQETIENPEVCFILKDLSLFSGPAIENEIKAASREPFDLEKGPLFKTYLFTLPGKEMVLLLVFHHIVVDGTSIQIILDELQRYYNALKGGESYKPTLQRATYQDFVCWQEDMLEGERGHKDLQFWRNQLLGEINPVDLYFDKTPPALPTYRGESHFIRIGSPLAGEIKLLSVREETTVFSVLLSAFKVLLYRYSSQEDIYVVTPVAGRPETRFEEIVGNFVNLVVIRSHLSGDKEFRTLLKEIGETAINALDHGNYPFGRITGELGKKHKKTAPQLFRTAFYLQNWKKRTTGNLFQKKDGFILEPYGEITQEGEFDLTLDVFPVEEGYRLCFKYNPDLFEERTIVNMAGHYTRVLEDIVKNPEKTISGINLLMPEERQKILVEWNDTSARHPLEKGVHDLFEEQAGRTPGEIAVIQGDRTATYRELNDRAARLANYLQRTGVDPGGVAGVYMDRSIEMLVGLLALFKAGCAFVPLDPAYPAERLSYMLENAGAGLLLTHSSADSGKLGFSGRIIKLDTLWNDIDRESSLYVNRANPSGLAYIIYTSGSTGKPKGVQTPQRGLVNFLCSMKKTPGFSERDLVLSITSICFDPFTVELFLPLAAGGKVELIPAPVARDGNALRQIIEKSRATVIQATPSTWQMLLAAGWDKKLPAKLLCGGEALTGDLAEKLLQRGEELWNVFGPTEATVWSAVGRIRTGDKITVGRPIDNIRYYVLDRFGNPVPAGVPGELYIGGEGLSPGYMNRPDLTSVSFIANFFDTSGSTTLYKSGDLVRFLQDGRVEYLGRVDHQVKLRGFRIELGEIEAALKRLEGIQNAAVAVRTDSEDHKHLFAFLVSGGSAGEMTGQEMALMLKSWLPGYMIPSRFVYLREFPLTPSRKVDRKYLSSAGLSEITRDYGLTDGEPSVPEVPREGRASRSSRHSIDSSWCIQGDLLNIIASILKIGAEEINDSANLGEYGFDSIRFTALSARLNEKYGINVSPALFYEYSTIKSIASLLFKKYSDAMKSCYGTELQGSSSIKPLAPRLEAPVISRASMAGVAEPVAIIGISGKMPQSSSLEEFWENLIANRDLITEIPRDRWDWNGSAAKEASKTKAVRGGFIRDVDRFDASFFGISPREAQLMDPQQRLFLEVAWAAIEDGGYRASDLSGTKIGVFVGVGSFDYWQVQQESLRPPDGHTLSGLAHSIIANRVSYLLNLKGPSASIDTACSSSLVSIHRAVKAIQGGLCDMALAGGVNALLSPFLFIASDRGGMMSEDGRCKTFDSSADGYVRGEGAGALLLKPLNRARADGDYIYGVIRGSAENHGGRTNSLTAPNPGAQADLLVEAYEEAGVDPATITYIETHGTGTSLGDPIEVNGLKKAFEELYVKRGRPDPAKAHCGLGSVKTNIGHLETAAGVAGVLKVLLAMRHKRLPGNLHFREKNPYINLENSPFYIVSQNMDWERLTDRSGSKIPRRAGVSSFGFGGSNAHVVIEEYSDQGSGAGAQTGTPHVFVLSAKNGDRLKEYAGRMVDYLEKRKDLQREPGPGSEELLQQIQEELAGILSRLLRVKAEDISLDEGFQEYCLDKVGLSRFASLINEKFKITLPIDKLSEIHTIRDLAHYLRLEKGNSHKATEEVEKSLQVSLADIAFTLQTGREAMDERLAVVASDADELIIRLKQFIDGKDSIDGLFRSNGGVGGDLSALLIEGEEGREFIRIIVKERKQNKLAQIWAAGAEIDWSMLYWDHLPIRVPLPTYPFARERHWISRPGGGNSRVSQAAPAEKKDQEAILYYRSKWVAAGINANNGGNNAPGDIWVFDTGEDLLEALKEKAQTEKSKESGLILIKPGNGYRELGSGMYEINPENQDDYYKLAEVLSLHKTMPAGIVHRWSPGRFTGSPDELKSQIGQGVLSLLYLSRAIMELKPKERVRLLLVYSGQEDQPQPQYAAVSGYARTVRLEYPKLDIRTLELSLNRESGDEASGLAEIVIGELGKNSGAAGEVRYEGGLRLVRRIEEFSPPVAGERELPLRDRGVYIITGGMGGLGLIFAEYLAVKVKAGLILSGRSDLSAEKKERIKRLEELGAEVIYVKADITRREDVEKLVDTAKSRFKGINGIIHGAGVIRDSLVIRKNKDDFKAVIAPKVFGTVYLDEATKAENLDFFVLFSSNSAVLGGAGQCDYAYGNSFLDSYAHLREKMKNSGIRSGKSLSLSWPLWRDGGMKANARYKEYMKRTFGIEELTAEAGLEAFERGLLADQSGVIVISGNSQKLERILNYLPFSDSKRQDGANTGKKALKSIEQFLVRLSSDILKVRQRDIDVNAKMSDYGFDSLCLMELADKINNTYGLDITPAVFYEYTTLRSLSGHLVEEYGQKLADLFGESEEETERPGLEADWEGYRLPALEEKDDPLKPGQHRTEQTAVEPVAVIGMSGVMPQSDDLEEFWKHLMEERDLITEIPGDRWNWREYYGDPTKEGNKSNLRWGGLIRDIDKFDASFFGIPDGEADFMDPQQRIFLETAWKTIEDAGYKPSDLSGTKTGVYVGVATLDYNDLLLEKGVDVKPYTPTGVSHSVLANRVSYLLNLRGPSNAINTACSSSLTAIQMGMEALRNGTCEMAIAGGVNAILSPTGFIYFGKSGVLSSEGKCRAFDRDAGGYVRGEGCGAVLLKPLSRAIKDKDNIYGVISGGAVNHGGHSNSLTAPSPKAQADLLVSAYEDALIDPGTITYIEAHGTGTSLGDSIEVSSLKKAFKRMYGRNGRPWPGETRCGLGTVKTNIGHLETAAGIAGVIKVLLSMKNGFLPASIHFNELNPYIRLEDSPFYIVDSTRPWERLLDGDGREIPRRAGVSSFGFGGVNAHLVIEEYTGRRPGAENREPCIIVLSAANEERLNIYAGKLLNYLEKIDDNNAEISLADVAYTLQVGREAMVERMAAVVADFRELREILTRYNRGDMDIDGLYRGSAEDNRLKFNVIVGGEDGAHFIRSLVAKKRYHKLAGIWALGGDINWELLYTSSKPGRVSLPTYPFARERHWMPVPATSNKTLPGREKIHPLIDRNVSTFREERFATVFTGAEFVLSDHLVAGQKTMPGAAFLEMARAAGEIAGERVVRKMTNVVWVSPLVVDGLPREVFTTLRPERGAVEFELYTGMENGARVVHSRGKLLFEGHEEDPAREIFNIQEIMARCLRVADGEECYRLLRETGFRYGPGFKVISELFGSERESLSRLDLPPEAGSGFVLHPSLLDGAIQTIVGMMSDSSISAGVPYLPFAVGEVEMFGPLSGPCYAHCTYAGDGQLGPEMMKFNIAIFDESGRVLLKIKDYTARPVLQNRTVDNKLDLAREDFDEKFYSGLLDKLARGEITPDAAVRMRVGA